MNKVVYFLIGGIVIAFSFLLCSNYLPPRTAYKAARFHSDLKIHSDFKVLNYTEEYTFNGEGVIDIVFLLDEVELEGLIQACKKKGYKKTSLDNLVADGFLNQNPDYGLQLYSRDIRKITNGYYKLKARDLSKMDFTIVVLDILNKELIIYVNIP